MDSIGNEELARIEEEDRKKGRILLGFLDDMPIYSRIGKQKEIKQKVDKIIQNEYKINQLIKELNKVNKYCGEEKKYRFNYEIIEEN